MAESLYLDLKNNDEAIRVWNNFIAAIIVEHGDYYTWAHITDTLAIYNAKYQFVPSKQKSYAKKHYIRFSSEAEMTAFILRYS